MGSEVQKPGLLNKLLDNCMVIKHVKFYIYIHIYIYYSHDCLTDYTDDKRFIQGK